MTSRRPIRYSVSSDDYYNGKRTVQAEESFSINSIVSSEGVTFEKGCLILIEGLGSDSDAGKKLNGKHGVIMGAPKSDNGGILRYPVRLYESEEFPVG
jgi:hypothetical protein